MASDTEFLEVSDSSSDDDDEDDAGDLIREFDRPKLPAHKLDITKHPPLPLIIFKGLGLRSVCAKTINGEEIMSIANNLSPMKRSGDSLQNILHTRRLAKWFVARSYKEAANRQPKAQFQLGTLGYEEQCTILDTLIYKSSVFGSFKKSNRTLSQRSSSITTELISGGDTNDSQIRKSALIFDSNFESGNLFKAFMVTGREKLMTPNTIKYLQSSAGSFSVPENVDQEYDLTLRNDLNTSGNIQWYYFSASSEDMLKDSTITRRNLYPLRVRFNIINMQKNDALYNYGMKPVTFLSTDVRDDWRHKGEDVCYYKHWTQPTEDISNNEVKKKKKDNTYVLTFTYTFLSPCTVYFAHSFPYTYSDLKRYLGSLEDDPRIARIMTRAELCTSIAGNICECITITNRSTEMNSSGPLKPAIIISSRIHPGESNSSYMMNGVIDFLVSENIEAKILRDNFVFKLIPMMNPDGVVHGNYRCSLMGTDLNRRYLNAHTSLYPTVSAMKNLLTDCQKKRGVLLFLDLHGHSKKKNCFLYGCDCTLQSEKMNSIVSDNHTVDEINVRKIYARTFAKVLCTVSDVNKGGYFSYRDSSFNVKSSKRSTGRVVSWRDLKIPGTFTIEASFCGSGNNDENKILKQYEDRIQYPDLHTQHSKNGNNNDNTDSYDSNDSINHDNNDSNTSKILSSSKSLIDMKNMRKQIKSDNIDSLLLRCRSNNELSKLIEISNDLYPTERTNNKLPKVSVNPLSPSYNGFKKRSNSYCLNSLTPTLAALVRKNSKDKMGSVKTRRKSSFFREIGNPIFEKLIKSYDTALHYTKEDLKNIGKDIVIGIFRFANLNGNDAALSRRPSHQSPRKLKKSPSACQKCSGTNSLESTERIDLETCSSEESEKFRGSDLQMREENEWKADILCSSFSNEDHRTEIGGEKEGEREIEILRENDPTFLNEYTEEEESKIESTESFLIPNYIDSSMLLKPLTKPSVFSVDAIQEANLEFSSIMQDPKDFTFLRIKCEMLIRQSLKIECPKGIGNRTAYGNGYENGDSSNEFDIGFGIGSDEYFNDDIDDKEQCVDDGSDSDPSVDNIPASKLLGKNCMANLKDTKRLMRALQKAVNKRHKISEEAARKLDRKRMKDMVEDSNSSSNSVIISSIGMGSGSGSALSGINHQKSQRTLVVGTGTGVGTVTGVSDGGIRTTVEVGVRKHDTPAIRRSSVERRDVTPIQPQPYAPSLYMIGSDSDSSNIVSSRSMPTGRLPRMSVRRSYETETPTSVNTNNNSSNNIKKKNYDNSSNSDSHNHNNLKVLIRPKSESRLIQNNPITLNVPYGYGNGNGHGGHMGYGSKETARGRGKSTHLKAFGPADQYLRYSSISKDSLEKLNTNLSNKNVYKNDYSLPLFRS